MRPGKKRWVCDSVPVVLPTTINSLVVRFKPRRALRRADICRERLAPLQSDPDGSGAAARTSVQCESWVFQSGGQTPPSSDLTPEMPCRDLLWQFVEPAGARDGTLPRGGAPARATVCLHGYSLQLSASGDLAPSPS